MAIDPTVRALNDLDLEIVAGRSIRSALQRAVLIGIARGRRLQRELDRIDLEESGLIRSRFEQDQLIEIMNSGDL